jgi:hypothetical protein
MATAAAANRARIDFMGDFMMSMAERTKTTRFYNAE